jgi:hypothetical protein
MKKPDQERTNESQSSDNKRLAAILQVERSDLKQEAVEAVLRSPASLRDKIERIEHIDGTNERHAQREPGHTTAFPAEGGELLAEGMDEDEQKELRRAKSNLVKLIKTQSEKRFLAFLLRDYGKVKRFGDKSGVLAAAFPFRFVLAKRALDRVASDLERVDLPALGVALRQIVQTGWRVLTRFEYNCVVELLEYCRCLAAAEFRSLTRNERRLVHRFKEMERLHILFHGDRNARDGVFAALAKICAEDPRGAAQARECEGRVRTLLADSEAQPTIGNLILGLNMMRWRRFVTMTDLADFSAGGFVCRTVFDCPDKVRLAIDAFVEARENRLNVLVQEYARIAEEVRFFPLDGKGGADYRDLIGFYGKQTDPDMPGSWKHDSQQVLSFLIRIVDLFVSAFRAPLSGLKNIRLAAGGDSFQTANFDSDFDFLTRARKLLERHTFLYGSISLTRFLEIRKTNKTATEIEAEAYSFASEILSRLRAIARKLSARLAPQEGADPENAVGPEDGSGAPAIPGQSGKDALRYVAGIAYGIGLFLADPTLWGLLGRALPLKEEFEAIMRTLKRVASARVFYEIQKKYILQ